MTMAVEDSARQAPMITDGAPPLPNSAAMPAMTAAHEDDLQAAEAEHQPAHGDEALVGKLQADEEHQEDDAELGEAGDVVGVGDGDPVEDRHISWSEPSPNGPRIAPAAR